MTSTEIIQAIRNEIERLKSIEYPCDNSQQATGFFNALDRMTDFLSTLESKKPVPKDLEEYASSAGFDYVDNIVQEHPGHRFNDHDVEYAYRDGIIAGAKWDRIQMMKEAIGGNAYPNDGEIWVDLARYGYKFKEGEPCRIIIVKE